MGVVDGDRGLGVGGLIAVPPLPLVGSLIACPKACVTTLAGSTGAPPRRVRPHLSPHAQILYFCENISNKQPKRFWMT